MLLTSNWIVLYAQTGDTLTCYTNNELKHIAKSVINNKECNLLLQITESQIKVKDSIINTQSKSIVLRDSTIMYKDSIIDKTNSIIIKNDKHIYDLNTSLNDANRKIKLIKIGWLGSTILLTLFALFI
jgi:hypothetical protein